MPGGALSLPAQWGRSSQFHLLHLLVPSMAVPLGCGTLVPAGLFGVPSVPQFQYFYLDCSYIFLLLLCKRHLASGPRES